MMALGYGERNEGVGRTAISDFAIAYESMVANSHFKNKEEHSGMFLVL